jgi:hypothetical protein
MDAGTVTLVLYLAGMGLPWWNLPTGQYSLMFPKMVHTRVPVRHPLGVPMRSKEACLCVAERERARGNKAFCQTPGEYFLRSEETGDLELATQLYIDTINGGQPHIVGGFPMSLNDDCHTKSYTHHPHHRETYVCVRVPVWIMDKRHWGLVGNRLVYKTSG